MCDQNPCVYGECYSSGGITFECNCDNGWTGGLCDIPEEVEGYLYENAKIIAHFQIKNP